MSFKNRIRLSLLGAILLCFGRCLLNDFVDWDDSRLIYQNENIANPTLAHLADPWYPWSVRNSHMYNPLVYSTWWVLANAAQLDTPDVLGATLNPIVFHAANLLVHWITVCLVLEIMLTLRIGIWPAIFGTLLFAIHPLQTEAVVWATAMKDLLCGLFSILCTWRYLVASQSDRPARTRTYWIATVCFIAALLSKPSAVVVPAMVAVVDLIVLRTPWRRVAEWTAPWFTFSVATALLARSVQKLDGIYSGPIWARPLVALDALAFYLCKLVVPLNLSIDYGRNPKAVMFDPALHHPLYWTWILPVGIAAAILLSKRRDLIAAALVFLLGVLPVLGLTTFVYQYWSTVADRYVYAAMLGVAWGFAILVARFRGRIAIVVYCCALTIFASLSFVQAGIWNNTAALMEHALALNQSHGMHFIFYGQYEDKLAAASFRQAKLAAQNGDAREAQRLLAAGNGYLIKAIDIYQEGKDKDLAAPKFFDNLSIDYIQLGRMDDAIAAVRQWIDRQPSYDEGSREKPGRLEDMLGSLYLRKGDYKHAVEWFDKSERVQSDPVTEQHLQYARKIAGVQPATAPATSPAIGR